MQEWTGMIVLAADCLYWTHDVEDSMRSKGLDGVKEVGKKMERELGDIVALVRGDIFFLGLNLLFFGAQLTTTKKPKVSFMLQSLFHQVALQITKPFMWC